MFVRNTLTYLKSKPVSCFRSFGSFEQSHFIPPRYFLVTYKLDKREYNEQIVINDSDALVLEHQEQVKRAVEDQKIVFKGEVLAQSGSEESEEPVESTEMSSTAEMEEIFFIFHGRDEREPHSFIKNDPFY